jgi:hypothetical protein
MELETLKQQQMKAQREQQQRVAKLRQEQLEAEKHELEQKHRDHLLEIEVQHEREIETLTNKYRLKQERERRKLDDEIR